jgi:hypothetical protein
VSNSENFCIKIKYPGYSMSAAIIAVQASVSGSSDISWEDCNGQNSGTASMSGTAWENISISPILVTETCTTYIHFGGNSFNADIKIQ